MTDINGFSQIETTGEITTETVYTDKVIINGGLSTQYLMGDGTLTTAGPVSSTSTNIYYYKSSTDLLTVPANGRITYNTTSQLLCGFIYISHLTIDSVDVEKFWESLGTSSILYTQDQNVSGNYRQYNITSVLVTIGSHVKLGVTLNKSGGVDYPDNHNILISFTVDAGTVDTRLNLVEVKTNNIQSTSSLLTQINSSVIVNDSINYVPVSNQTQSNDSFITVNSTQGFKFSIASTISIKRIGVPIIHSVTSVSNIYKIYLDGNTTALYTYTVPHITTYNNYYILDVNISLPAGTYRIGVNTINGDTYNLTAFTIFDPRFSNIQGCGAIGFNYPSTVGLSNTIYSGMLWIGDALPSTIYATGTINTVQGFVIPGSSNNFLLADGTSTPISNYQASNPNTRNTRYFVTKYASNTQGSATGNFNLLSATQFYGSYTIPANDVIQGDTLNIRVNGRWTLPSNSLASIIFGIGGFTHTCSFITNPQITNGNFEIICRWCCLASGTVAIFNVISIGNMGNTGQTSTTSVFGGVTASIQLNTTISNTVTVVFANPTYITSSITVYNIAMFRE